MQLDLMPSPRTASYTISPVSWAEMNSREGGSATGTVESYATVPPGHKGSPKAAGGEICHWKSVENDVT